MQVNNQHWTNRCTYEMYCEICREQADELAVTIALWEDESQGKDFTQDFADALQEDCERDYIHSWCDDNFFLAAACEILMARVDWLQVAEQLIRYAADDVALLRERQLKPIVVRERLSERLN
jgi:hypothetical protein